jgi:taurine dioxygenase
VRGVDLAAPLADGTVAALRRALAENSILLFRGQDLTPAQHLAASRRFGTFEPHVANQFHLPGHPDIFVVSNIVENGRHIGAHGGARHWHSDYSYRERPALGSLFHCVECPPEGGETQFAGMFAAYDALDDGLKARLAGLRAVHDYVYYWENYTPHRGPLSAEQKAKLRPTPHPLVIAHPETGRPSLYLAHNVISHVEGMDPDEGLALIEEVVALATRPQFVYTHRWREGDLVFWDNRSSMHRVLPFDESRHRRRMHRTTLTGSRPVAAFPAAA